MRITREVYLLQPFSNTDNCNFSIQLKIMKAFKGRIQLALAPIDDDQLGQCLFFIHHSFVATENHFAHGREIIGPGNGFYIEMPIIFRGRFAIPEYYAGCNRVCALEIGIIKAFYVYW
jgi:hypothetical protein